MAQHIDHIPGSIIYNTGSLPLFVSTEKQSSRSRSKAVVHWHDEIELVHVLEGTMIYIINESYENLKAGDFLFINARQMHWTNQWQRRECRYNIIQVDPNIVGTQPAVRELLEPVFGDELFSYLLLRRGSDRAAMFTSCIDRIVSNRLNQNFGYELEVMQDIFTIFRNLFYFYSFEDRIHYEKEDEDRLLFQGMLSFIYASFREKLTLEDIAGSANICRSKCCRLFRRFSQTSPIDFVNSYRIDQGARMLTETDSRISLISQECGFSQQSYFNRLFLKSYGCTPGEYRKRARMGRELLPHTPQLT